jgi:hypothetical protein
MVFTLGYIRRFWKALSQFEPKSLWEGNSVFLFTVVTRFSPGRIVNVMKMNEHGAQACYISAKIPQRLNHVTRSGLECGSLDVTMSSPSIQFGNVYFKVATLYDFNPVNFDTIRTIAFFVAFYARQSRSIRPQVPSAPSGDTFS